MGAYSPAPIVTKSIEKKSILGGMANIAFVGLTAEEIKKKIGKKKISPTR